MKKVLSFLLLALLIGVSMPAEAAEQAKSEVGITFYQPSNKNQTIPMEKVSMNDSKSDAPQMGAVATGSGSKMYPKTNEEKITFIRRNRPADSSFSCFHLLVENET